MGDVTKKGAARRFMEFIKMVIIGNLILSAPILLYLLYSNFVNVTSAPGKIFQVAFICGFYIFTAALVAVYYLFWSSRYSLFIPSIIFISLPFFLYFALGTMRLIVDIKSCPAGWEIAAVLVAFAYSLPFFIITLIASFLKKHGMF